MMRFGGLGMLAGGLVGLLVAAVITVLAVLAIIALVKYIKPAGGHGHNGFAQMHAAARADSALQILNERLAKGEIDEEEYARKKELLMKQ